MKFKMSLSSIFYVLVFLTFEALVDGCRKSEKPKPIKHRKARETEASIAVGKSGYGLVLRTPTTKMPFMDNVAEKLFQEIDANSNGMVEADEWVDYSKDASIWDFVEILSHIDRDDDEAISFDGFSSVEVVEMDHTRGKNGAGVTS